MNLFKIITIVILCIIYTSSTRSARDTGMQSIITISKSSAKIKNPTPKLSIQAIIYPPSNTTISK